MTGRWMYRLGSAAERQGTDIYRTEDSVLVRWFDDEEAGAADGWVDHYSKVGKPDEEADADGNSEVDELERLRDIARAGGIDVDLRWGARRLQREIDRA